MKLALALCVLAVGASSAYAGGPVTPAPEPVVMAPVAPAPVGIDWTGFYAGVQYENLTGGGSLTPPGIALDLDGNVAGVFAGYRRDFGRLVVGGELDYVKGDFTWSGGALLPTDLDVDSMIRVGPEVGFDLGRVMVYGTAGYAKIDITNPAVSQSDSSGGYFYGIGADVLVSNRITVGVEVLRHKFDDFSGPLAVSNTVVEPTTAGLNVAIRF